MSSLEIANLTTKRHSDVLRDIRNTLEQAAIDATQFCVTQNYGNGNTREIFNLPRLECDLVVSGYSVKYRLAIIKRWHELEILNQSSTSRIQPQNQADLMVSAGRTFGALMRSAKVAKIPLPMALRRAAEVTLRETGIDLMAELKAEDHLNHLDAIEANKNAQTIKRLELAMQPGYLIERKNGSAQHSQEQKPLHDLFVSWALWKKAPEQYVSVQQGLSLKNVDLAINCLPQNLATQVFEQTYIKGVRNYSKTATLLNISRNHFHRLLRQVRLIVFNHAQTIQNNAGEV